MGEGAEKEGRTREWQHELGQAELGAVLKGKLRERVARVVKGNLEHQKVAQKAENKRVLDAVHEHFAREAAGQTLVLRIEVSPGSKAVQEALKTLAAKQKDKSVYLLGTAEDKVVHGCVVSEAASAKGLDANQWANAVAGV
ncbi:Alanine--tRNA ligase, partial [Teratosphaeriaceae sp. CCFEE 6253]